MVKFCVTQRSTMKDEKYYSIGDAAAIVHTTSETLRHYDRIGLVKPGKKDEWTGYRYYTDADIIRLNTVRLLSLMDLSLKEIRKVLDFDNLEEIIAFLDEAEMKADEKIAELERGKEKIRAAKADYESKLRWKQVTSGVVIKDLPERVILLSDTLEAPSLDNLWNYHSNFYKKIPAKLKDSFKFEDLAGIYSDDDITRLFALCIDYKKIDGMKILPAGKYLSLSSSEDEREDSIKKLKEIAEKEYGVKPSFILQLIIISGILNWNYEIQLYIGQE